MQSFTSIYTPYIKKRKMTCSVRYTIVAGHMLHHYLSLRLGHANCQNGGQIVRQIAYDSLSLPHLLTVLLDTFCKKELSQVSREKDPSLSLMVSPISISISLSHLHLGIKPTSCKMSNAFWFAKSPMLSTFFFAPKP